MNGMTDEELVALKQQLKLRSRIVGSLFCVTNDKDILLEKLNEANNELDKTRPDLEHYIQESMLLKTKTDALTKENESLLTENEHVKLTVAEQQKLVEQLTVENTRMKSDMPKLNNLKDLEERCNFLKKNLEKEKRIINYRDDEIDRLKKKLEVLQTPKTPVVARETSEEESSEEESEDDFVMQNDSGFSHLTSPSKTTPKGNIDFNPTVQSTPSAMNEVNNCLVKTTRHIGINTDNISESNCSKQRATFSDELEPPKKKCKYETDFSPQEIEEMQLDSMLYSCPDEIPRPCSPIRSPSDIQLTKEFGTNTEEKEMKDTAVNTISKETTESSTSPIEFDICSIEINTDGLPQRSFTEASINAEITNAIEDTKMETREIDVNTEIASDSSSSMNKKKIETREMGVNTENNEPNNDSSSSMNKKKIETREMGVNTENNEPNNDSKDIEMNIEELSEATFPDVNDASKVKMDQITSSGLGIETMRVNCDINKLSEPSETPMNLRHVEVDKQFNSICINMEVVPEKSFTDAAVNTDIKQMDTLTANKALQTEIKTRSFGVNTELDEMEVTTILQSICNLNIRPVSPIKEPVFSGRILNKDLLDNSLLPHINNYDFYCDASPKTCDREFSMFLKLPILRGSHPKYCKFVQFKFDLSNKRIEVINHYNIDNLRMRLSTLEFDPTMCLININSLPFSNSKLLISEVEKVCSSVKRKLVPDLPSDRGATRRLEFGEPNPKKARLSRISNKNQMVQSIGDKNKFLTNNKEVVNANENVSKSLAKNTPNISFISLGSRKKQLNPIAKLKSGNQTPLLNSSEKCQQVNPNNKSNKNEDNFTKDNSVSKTQQKMNKFNQLRENSIPKENLQSNMTNLLGINNLVSKGNFKLINRGNQKKNNPIIKRKLEAQKINLIKEKPISKEIIEINRADLIQENLEANKNNLMNNILISSETLKHKDNLKEAPLPRENLEFNISNLMKENPISKAVNANSNGEIPISKTVSVKVNGGDFIEEMPISKDTLESNSSNLMKDNSQFKVNLECNQIDLNQEKCKSSNDNLIKEIPLSKRNVDSNNSGLIEESNKTNLIEDNLPIKNISELSRTDLIQDKLQKDNEISFSNNTLIKEIAQSKGNVDSNHNGSIGNNLITKKNLEFSNTDLIQDKCVLNENLESIEDNLIKESTVSKKNLNSDEDLRVEENLESSNTIMIETNAESDDANHHEINKEGLNNDLKCDRNDMPENEPENLESSNTIMIETNVESDDANHEINKEGLNNDLKCDRNDLPENEPENLESSNTIMIETNAKSDDAILIEENRETNKEGLDNDLKYDRNDLPENEPQSNNASLIIKEPTLIEGNSISNQNFLQDNLESHKDGKASNIPLSSATLNESQPDTELSDLELDNIKDNSQDDSNESLLDFSLSESDDDLMCEEDNNSLSTLKPNNTSTEESPKPSNYFDDLDFSDEDTELIIDLGEDESVEYKSLPSPVSVKKAKPQVQKSSPAKEPELTDLSFNFKKENIDFKDDSTLSTDFCEYEEATQIKEENNKPISDEALESLIKSDTSSTAQLKRNRSNKKKLSKIPKTLLPTSCVTEEFLDDHLTLIGELLPNLTKYYTKLHLTKRHIHPLCHSFLLKLFKGSYPHQELLEFISKILQKGHEIRTKEFVCTSLHFIQHSKQNPIYEYCQGKTDLPLLTIFESQMVRILIHASSENPNHLNLLIQSFMLGCLERIRKIPDLLGKSSLCRIYIALCRKYSLSDKAIALLNVIVRTEKIRPAYIIVSILAVWPDLIKPSDDNSPILCNLLMQYITILLNKDNDTYSNTLGSVLSSLQVNTGPTVNLEDPQFLENMFEFALQLKGRKMRFLSLFSALLVKFVVQRPLDWLQDVFVENYLIPRINYLEISYFKHWFPVSLELTKTLVAHCPNDKEQILGPIFICIKVAVLNSKLLENDKKEQLLYILLTRLPSNQTTLEPIIKQWFEANKATASQSITSFIGSKIKLGPKKAKSKGVYWKNIKSKRNKKGDEKSSKT